jgi:hypothetical protein
MNQAQRELVSGAFVNFGIGVVLTGVVAPLLQTSLLYGYPQFAMVGGFVGLLSVAFGLLLRRKG